MYQVYLSHFQLKEYLPMLTERSLLTYNADTRTFDYRKGSSATGRL
jgi:hypothetical protein